jgi:hypothetical protein
MQYFFACVSRSDAVEQSVIKIKEETKSKQ